MPSLNYFDKDKQEWVAIPLGGGTDADLSAYATTEYVDGQTGEIKAAATVAFTERYTKQEVDAKVAALQQGVDDANLGVQGVADLVPFVAGELSTQIDAKLAGKADQSEFSAFQGQYGTLESEFREYFRLLNQGFATVAQKPDVDAALDLKADKTAVSGLSTTLMNSIMEVKDGTYTKPEVDEAIAGAVSGQLTPEQITEIISQVGPVDLTAYAKISDNTQNLLAKVVTAQGYGFGDKNEPPAALTYTDTGEGYGERLVLATGSSIEYVVMKSDFDPLKSRMDALESKAAPTIDAYTKAECDAKFLTLVDIDRFAYQADVYTQKQVDDRFMRIDQAFSKVDFDNQMALMLYSRKQVDDKLAAISPVGANSINDPALAGFKTSILDAVKLMLVGGTKMPPADIDWTWMVRMDGAKESVSTEIQARMIGGFIELKGTLSFGAGSGAWVPLRLPPQFPMAELEASYPLAMRLVGTAVTYGYCTVSNKNRDISCSPGAKSSEANFSGIRWKAAY
jgi:hypothetical protein